MVAFEVQKILSKNRTRTTAALPASGSAIKFISPAMSDPHSNDGLRVFKSSIFPDVPLCIGRKGASWFLCFSRPVGARGTRIHACINRIDTSFPFPSELPQGQTQSALDTRGQTPGMLQLLLK